MSMIIPPALQLGDSITLISTARKIDKDQLDDVIAVFEKQGYKVKLGANLLASDHQFCGTDKQRAQDLQQAINDTDSKAIICFRGGYGTVRMLHLVDFTPLHTQPKWISGYSDVTVLHNTLYNLGLASLHSTMPVNFGSNSTEAIDSLFASLQNKPIKYLIAPSSQNTCGTTSGTLIGGNLSILYSLSGTTHDVDTKGKILFIEDLDEYLYHIDRIMWNLKLSNKLNQLKGLIVGGMTDMNDNSIPFGKTAVEIIQEHTRELNIPICYNFPAGHIDDNRTLVLGKNCELKVTDEFVKFSQ